MNKKALFIFPILLICVNVSAQKAVLGLVKKVGSLIDSMSVRGLDRNYIEAPTKPWQIILRGNMNQSSVSMNTEGSIEGLSYRGYATNVEELMEDPTFWSDNIDNNKWDEWFYGNLRITPMGDKTFNSGMKVNFDARLSVTYNFGRYFVNAYGQFNNMRYSHQSSYGHLNDWFINTSIGIRL